MPFCSGAKKLIEHLSYNKVPIAVATSSSEQSYHQKTAVHKELFSHMHHVVKGSTDPEVINGKPAPDIFRIAAARFPNPPPTSKVRTQLAEWLSRCKMQCKMISTQTYLLQCLAFEDAPNGVLSATSAGMQCVMVPEDYIPEELTKKATLVLKSLVDFKPEEFGLPPYN
ncbi:unnamed protein product [Nesidiocoris tenuis]|uniref:Uncharacterized protein n=1 Tax=Nesidiocoris tenuis TaxID=355587 RepID=A0A6H5H678_9HEMI|nr:unnamed protein product [Nesidiocoris tenuis]CAB0009115.1 unnamed protein product [Nesidiocoris tenuis]